MYRGIHRLRDPSALKTSGHDPQAVIVLKRSVTQKIGWVENGTKNMWKVRKWYENGTKPHKLGHLYENGTKTVLNRY